MAALALQQRTFLPLNAVPVVFPAPRSLNLTPAVALTSVLMPVYCLYLIATGQKFEGCPPKEEDFMEIAQL